MESCGEPLKIHISPQCKEKLDKLGGYLTEERGAVSMKGKGEIVTYWLIGKFVVIISGATFTCGKFELLRKVLNSQKSKI